MPESPPNLLATLIAEENMLVELPSEERSVVVKTMIQNLVASGRISKGHAPTVAKLVNDREALGSTAIGGGVAIPHARIPFSDDPIMAFALLKDGVGFNALDGGSVNFVFMVLTPKKDDEMHRTVLKAITSFAKKHIPLKALRGCVNASDIKSVFQDYA